ncbi:hypothetical protein M1C57_16780 [Rhodococcus pyridinivorans]|uniref:hypothetical protein n=1 Tax=Rhodococcus pyridinivorans TaxID=103816 RepID=UPI00110DBB0B|nr:hypothetical protein [Rhodococcus pyridinivorans]UPW03309.1 hypothetical protein M1C57_16780 [Rhodococcus pyridinivorans]
MSVESPATHLPASGDDPLALERQVCFALAVANRAVLAVYRPRSAADERQLVLELTDAGRALRAEAESVPGQVVDALGVGLDELQDLHAALVRVNAAALKAGAL